MSPLFIPVKSKIVVDKAKIIESAKKLPKNIAIAYTSQYEIQAKEIKTILSKSHNIIDFIQVLGCSRPKIKSKAILLIGDGKFHAVSLAVETGFPIYICTSNKIEKISDKEINKLKQKQKASYVKFLNSNKIGILVSTKPGQQNLKTAINIKRNLKNKTSYLFICNNIDVGQFENFPNIQSWVNTACPRIDMNDSRIINADKIKL